MGFRNTGKPRVRLHEKKNIIPQIQEILNDQINDEHVIRIDVRHGRQREDKNQIGNQ